MNDQPKSRIAIFAVAILAAAAFLAVKLSMAAALRLPGWLLGN